MTDEELMCDLNKWLITPELQHRPNSDLIAFLSSIHLYWRINNRITEKQRNYTCALLNKHWTKK